ncbi:UDP-N-acetylglucosamine-transferase [Methylobacter sp. S3L5C]|uniref:UDP-N-acetylglucosamine-transferase n=1 Tax=Methylobacter sp. S3L5C TaxID=2839024 RepID=UPI001FADDB6D|nr:UDP-N-acetylglucosamine-transferase [Methylobacter sp. S3L5C]UOA07497.1 hypothetical protein KKZ03_14645 [Methylobacter sp. S3L5C]
MIIFPENKSNKTIFIQIAAYRDPELNNTLASLLSNAKYPEELRIGIAWQHNIMDKWDNLDNYINDDRFRIIDINFLESKGCCWARNQVQQQYQGEDYTLQIDSHHRFSPDWDEILINMLINLQSEGYPKPLITGYMPSYDPNNDPAGRINELWKMNFDRFIPEGAIFFLPAQFDDFDGNEKPVRSRFYSAHFAFTLGQFALEVQHDPDYYFHGEEISITVRAFTHGYDLFHPNIIICWHEYTRNGRAKHWDDVSSWGEKNQHSHHLNRILFRMDGQVGTLNPKYGFGSTRTLHDYEKYAGISFEHRAIQQETLDHKEPPNTSVPEDQWEISLLSIFKHCIDIGYDQVPESDYDFWCVVFKDEHNNDLYRQDADEAEITTMKNDPDRYCKIWREFETKIKPKRWVVWPHSKSKDWCTAIHGELP